MSISQSTITKTKEVKPNSEVKTSEELKLMDKEARKTYFNTLRDKDRQLVRGKFIFHEVPGGMMSFSFVKWHGDALQTYHLTDGEIYTLPLAVAKHLNKECKYPIHSYSMDENKKPQMKINQWIRRCSFQSLEFFEPDDITSN